MPRPNDATWTTLTMTPQRVIRYSLDARPGYARFMICDFEPPTVRVVDVAHGTMSTLLDDIADLSR